MLGDTRMNVAIFWIAAREWSEILVVLTVLWKRNAHRHQVILYSAAIGFAVSIALGIAAIYFLGERIPKSYLNAGTVMVGCYLLYRGIRGFGGGKAAVIGVSVTSAFSVIREIVEMVFMIGLGSAGRIDWLAFSLGTAVGIVGPIWFLNVFERLNLVALPLVGSHLILHGLQFV